MHARDVLAKFGRIETHRYFDHPGHHLNRKNRVRWAVDEGCRDTLVEYDTVYRPRLLTGLIGADDGALSTVKARWQKGADQLRLYHQLCRHAFPSTVIDTNLLLLKPCCDEALTVLEGPFQGHQTDAL